MRNSTVTRKATIFKRLLISKIVYVIMIPSFQEESAEEIKKNNSKNFYLAELNSQTMTELHTITLKTMVSKASP